MDRQAAGAHPGFDGARDLTYSFLDQERALNEAWREATLTDQPWWWNYRDKERKWSAQTRDEHLQGLHREGQARPGAVYFIEAGVGGPVKIGLVRPRIDLRKTNLTIEATDQHLHNIIQTRISAMQTGCPLVLSEVAHIMTFDPQETESRYHRRCSGSRIHGEWFHRTREVQFSIEEAKLLHLKVFCSEEIAHSQKSRS